LKKQESYLQTITPPQQTVGILSSSVTASTEGLGNGIYQIDLNITVTMTNPITRRISVDE